MATRFIGELNQPRRFSIDNTLKREYTRAFIVITDAPVRGPLEASIACGIRFGEIYRTLSTSSGEWEYDAGAAAYKFEAAPEDPDCNELWRITVTYGSHIRDPAQYTAGGGTSPSTQGGGGQNELPTSEPAKIVWGKQARKVALYQALNSPPINNGNKFQTSAREPFRNTPEVDRGLITLTITRNESTFDQVAAEEYWDCVNAWPFYGFLEFSVLCDSITGFRDYRNKIQFWQVTYVFIINNEIHGWNWKPVDKGTKYLVAGVQKDAPTEIGRVKEVYLDGSGGQLATTSAPVLLDFVIHPEIDFNPLNLE